MLIEYGCGLTHVLSNTDTLRSIKIDNFIEPCRGTRKKSPARFYEVIDFYGTLLVSVFESVATSVLL